MAAKKCSCNWGLWIVALILMTIGFWALVTGFIMHFTSTAALSVTAQAVMPWYFAGFLVFGLGMMAKWKACSCGMHGK
jgi:membrane-bound ClpP family serine protease